MLKKLFKPKKIYEPLDYERRKYFENNILCLVDDFSETQIENRKVFLPTENDFPIKWNQSEENAIEVLKIVSKNIQLDFDEIEIDYYIEGVTEMNTGSSPIFLENDENESLTSSFYFGRNEQGKYEIGINKKYLGFPETLTATIAHELSHVKLLGENKIQENDEYLTDLATVFFGFGIFGANASFQFYQENDRWGYSSGGYLKFDEWAYCLALFAFLREEDEPEWSNYLNPTIKKEFNRCLKYMLENEDEIFKLGKDN